MALELRSVRADDVRSFSAWRYEEPYDAYNDTDGSDEAVEYFLDPSLNCYVLVDGDDLVGFCTFGPDGQVPGGNYDSGAVDIGLGIRPDLTGQGRGDGYVAAVVAQAELLFPHKPMRVTITGWNERALRVWITSGFTHASRFAASRTALGGGECVILERREVGSTSD